MKEAVWIWALHQGGDVWRAPVGFHAPDEAGKGFVCTRLSLCLCDAADAADAAPCLVRKPAVVADLWPYLNLDPGRRQVICPTMKDDTSKPETGSALWPHPPAPPSRPQTPSEAKHNPPRWHKHTHPDNNYKQLSSMLITKKLNWINLCRDLLLVRVLHHCFDKKNVYIKCN